MVTPLRGLNCHTRRHHQAMNVRIPITPEEVERAGNRLSLLLPALVAELGEVAGEPGLAEAATMALTELRDDCEDIMARFPETLPPAPASFGETASSARDALLTIRTAFAAVAVPPDD